jgi:hypothetical protein
MIYITIRLPSSDQIPLEKVGMVTRPHSFVNGGLVCVDSFDSNETLTHDNFINFLLFDLKKHGQNLRRRKRPIELAAHMENSCCHSEQIVPDKMMCSHITRLDHPSHLPDVVNLS